MSRPNEPMRQFPDSYRAPNGFRLDHHPLGMGNTAIVYAGVRISDNLPVAVKYYNPLLTDEFGKKQEAEEERFRREFAAASQIVHPNIVSVLATGQSLAEDGTPLAPFMVMERLAEDLRSRLTQGPVSSSVCIPWLRGLANGLSAIHECGIIHRDIKPANVMFRGQVPVIVDFGFSKNISESWMTAPGEFLGSLDYASPEQLQSSAHVTTKSDVFSLGLMGVELATGKHPCPWLPTDSSYRSNRTRSLAIDDKTIEAIPAGLRDILIRCVAMSADARPTSSQLAEALSEIDAEAGR